MPTICDFSLQPMQTTETWCVLNIPHTMGNVQNICAVTYVLCQLPKRREY